MFQSTKRVAIGWAVAVCLLVSSASYASNKISPETVKVGNKLNQTFICAAYYSWLEMPEEGQRLFKIGYKAGIKFLQGLDNEGIRLHDLFGEVPVSTILSIDGSIRDFFIGLSWASAFDHVTEKILKSSEGNFEMHDTYEDTYKYFARKFISEANCDLIG